MKKAQISTAVAVFLIVIVLILATIALTVILVNSTDNDLMGKYFGKSPQKVQQYEYEQRYTVPFQKPTEEIICSLPYIKVGLTCCLDKNYNSICDNDEIEKISDTYTNGQKNLCEYPYRDVGSKCCLDDNHNGRCDYEDDYSDRENTDVTLSRPFSVYDHNVQDDEITLWIKNRGDETLTILLVEIDDCNDADDDVTLEKDERERFDFDCDKDREFDRDITVTYTVEGSTEEKTSRGSVERNDRSRSYLNDEYY